MIKKIFSWFESRIDPYPEAAPKTPEKGLWRFVWSNIEGLRKWIAVLAVFTAGIGTLLFQSVTGRQVPVFLASSFAFIAPIIAAKASFGLPAVLGGVVAAGLVYVLLGGLVKLKGPAFIDRLLPPVVIAPVIISIGLALSPVATGPWVSST